MLELAQYTPLTEIRTNLRFATYRGELAGEPVFVKAAASENTRGKLLAEVVGLANMAELDPATQFYRTPHVIEAAHDYVVASWADGESMGRIFAQEIRVSYNTSDTLQTYSHL